MFPQGLGFVLVFEFMVSDLSEMIRDASNHLTKAQVKPVFPDPGDPYVYGFLGSGSGSFHQQANKLR